MTFRTDYGDCQMVEALAQAMLTAYRRMERARLDGQNIDSKYRLFDAINTLFTETVLARVYLDDPRRI